MKIYLNFKLSTFGDIEELHCAKPDKYLRVLLVACKRAFYQKMAEERITNHEWIHLVYNIYTMERMIFKLRTQIDIFDEN